ncbi:selenide, water dikinase SelD [Serinicoccus marinus]|uniref:selenide, water dikinase SelD n=1 Tax=Serinicoccus marinus TaxID=247333 RepID=UPI001EE9AA52|nr:selenide, water dikinase SelD [Serinicoccus marinus]
MGGTPVLAINLLGWPADLDDDLAREVLRGGAEVAALAGFPLAGGHSVTSPEPLYGLAVTGTARADALIRNDARGPRSARHAHQAARHRHPQQPPRPDRRGLPEAVATMTALNREASADAVGAGVRAGTDVTGFGLLGHLWKLCRASGVAAEIDVAAVPTIPGARESLTAGYLPGGSRRNLDWVRPHLETGAGVDEDDLLLLADAQTSGGLLLVGEVPDGVGTLIGRTVPAAGGGPTLHLR